MGAFSGAKRALASLLVFTLVIQSASFGLGAEAAQAQSRGPIPDDIDHQKYHRDYLRVKQVSDEKRGKANELQSRAQEIDQGISSREQRIRDNDSQIEANTAESRKLGDEIPALESRNRGLSEELGRHRSEHAAKERTLKDLNQRYGALQEELARDQGAYDRTLKDLAETDRLIAQNAASSDRAGRDLNAVDAKYASAVSRRDSNLSRIAELDRESTRLRDELAQVERRLREVEAQIPSQRERVASLQQRVANQRAQIETLRAEVRRTEAALQPLEQSLRQKRERLAVVNRQIPEHTRQIEALTRKIEALDQNIAAVQGALRQAQEELPSQQRKKPDAEKKLDGLRNTRAGHQAELDTLEKSRVDLNTQISQKQAERRALERRPPNEARDAEIKRIEAEIARLTVERDAVVGKQRGLRQEIQKLDPQITQAESELGAIVSRIAELEKTIQTQSANLAAYRRDREASAKSLEEHKSGRDRALTEQSQLATAIADLEPRYNQAVQAHSQAKASLERALPALQTLEAEARKAEEQLESSNATASTLRSRSQSIRHELTRSHEETTRLRNELPELDRDITRLASESQRLRRELEILTSERSRLTATRERLYTSAIEQEKRLKELTDRAHAVYAEIDRVDREASALSELIRSKSEQLSANEKQIKANRERIHVLAQYSSDLAQDTAAARDQLRSLRAQQPGAWEQYKSADQAAREAEAVTQEKLVAYQRVKGNYDTRLAAAREKGRAQGETHGKADGETQGKTEGVASGTQEGEAKGREEGLKHGYEKGRAAGEVAGRQEGYEHGRNAPANFEQGRQAGAEQGRKDAQIFAQQTEYPRGRRDRKDELLSRIPERHIVVDPSQPRAAPLSEPGFHPISGRLSDSDGGYTEAVLAKPELKEKRNSLPSFERIESAEWENEERSFLIRGTVDPRRAVCGPDYIDFEEGCIGSYKSAYADHYARTYATHYAAAKAEAYPRARQAAFEASKELRWQEGFDEAYAVAYREADARGASDARADGYEKGKVEGYQAELEPAKTIAYNNGLADESRHFESNAVVRLLDAGVTRTSRPEDGEGFMANDSFSVKLELANFGSKAAEKGRIQVRFEPLTRNLVLEDPTKGLVEIPAQTRVTALSVAFGRIGAQAGAQEPIRFKVIATLPDGTVQEKVVEFSTTELHILAQLEKEFESRPMIFTGSPRARLPLKHTIRITVRNPTPSDAQKPFRVVLIDPGISGLVVNTGEAQTEVLRSGQSDSVELKYTLRSSSLRGRSIALEVMVYYGERESARDKVMIVPQDF